MRVWVSHLGNDIHTASGQEATGPNTQARERGEGQRVGGTRGAGEGGEKTIERVTRESASSGTSSIGVPRSRVLPRPLFSPELPKES